MASGGEVSRVIFSAIYTPISFLETQLSYFYGFHCVYIYIDWACFKSFDSSSKVNANLEV